MAKKHYTSNGIEQIGWDIFLHGVWQNTVYYTATCDKDYVRDSLISHDGYADNIEIVQKPQPLLGVSVMKQVYLFRPSGGGSLDVFSSRWKARAFCERNFNKPDFQKDELATTVSVDGSTVGWITKKIVQ